MERLSEEEHFFKSGTGQEQELQELVALAGEICQVPTAFITLSKQGKQVISYTYGELSHPAQLNEVFIQRVMSQPELVLIPDLSKDNQFTEILAADRNLPFRFLAGIRLTTASGEHCGCLCMMGLSPQKLSPVQRKMLLLLARQVTCFLESERGNTVWKEQLNSMENIAHKFQSLFDSFSSFHLLLDKKMSVIAFNKAAALFFEHERGVNIEKGMNILSCVHPDYKEEFTHHYKTALSGKRVESQRQLSYQQQAIIWNIVYEPAYNSLGQIIGVSSNSTDITKTVEREKTILLQNESLKKIAFIQSHELRKPVASLIGFMNIFKAEGYKANKEELMMMEKAVNMLNVKMQEIIDFTR
ncbi:hypothetical protein ACSBL2_25150 [Pedobacter sp. AW31-3R]|uniref:hypothetical protein n=1 Tax=Pedobacter sp. AW31-3R TaxID=3445781 RepID=UPI003FA122D2